MTKIIVKNGNWDEAQAKLAADFAAKKNAFDAKFGAAFGAKPEEPKPSTPAPAPAEKPKTRYVVGTNARIQAVVARLVPDGMKDWLVTREMGLSRQQ